MFAVLKREIQSASRMWSAGCLLDALIAFHSDCIFMCIISAGDIRICIIHLNAIDYFYDCILILAMPVCEEWKNKARINWCWPFSTSGKVVLRKISGNTCGVYVSDIYSFLCDYRSFGVWNQFPWAEAILPYWRSVVIDSFHYGGVCLFPALTDQLMNCTAVQWFYWYCLSVMIQSPETGLISSGWKLADKDF